MALVVYDRVQETTATTGTGSLTLGGAVAGYQSFAVVGNGNTTFYCIINGTQWEVGIGTYSTSGPTLARTTVLSTSTGTASAITLSGASNVFVTYPAEKSVNRDANGNVNISYTPNVATNIGALNVGDGTYSTSATGQLASFASADATYANVILQNTNNTSSSAYSSYVTAANNYPNQYMEIGSNSTNYNATAAGFVMNSLNAAGANFVQSYGSDLTLATWTNNNIHFIQNATAATTDSMTLYADGGASLGGLGDPGIGNIAINNAIVGLTAITASTTAVSLTSSSTQVQAVSGSTTQRINLPQATTLLKGTFYTVANTSTGNVSVYDNAGTLLETITTGGAAQFLCVSNATSAGTWGVRVFASSNTQWGNSTLTYPGTIASATWNGTTIGTGYGGTGLTTFSSSNYAIYSTSPSTLVAGTLPVLAGGTGVTTSTGSGSAVLNTSPTLVTPTLGVASATSLTLGSALTIANGGTGQTTASAAFNVLSPITTTGDLIIGTGTNTASRLGIGSSGYSLVSNGTTAVWTAPTSTNSSLTIADFTATAGQTTFSLTYTPALVEGVYRNGIKLGLADYTATNGTTIVLGTSAVVGDLIEVVYFSAISLASVVNSINFGSTGLTPATSTNGNVTVAGTLGIANGGTGLTSVGTSGYYLQSTGSGLQYAAVSGGGGSTVTPTSSATTFYIVGTNATAGTLTAYISNTNAVSYNASTGALTAVSVTSSSDERLKQDIETITDALTKVETMRGVTYLRNGVREIGVVAQEVERVVPEVVYTEDGEYGYKSVSYGNMVGLLIEAVKELSAEVKALKAELNDTSK